LLGACAFLFIVNGWFADVFATPFLGVLQVGFGFLWARAAQVGFNNCGIFVAATMARLDRVVPRI